MNGQSTFRSVIANNFLRSFFLIFITFFIGCTAFAVQPSKSLKEYGYENMRLLKISRASDGQRVACFYGAHPRSKGEYTWISVHSEIGSRFSTVSEIQEDAVVMEEMISVNGNDWVVAKFFWPLANDGMSRALAPGCKSPQ